MEFDAPQTCMTAPQTRKGAPQTRMSAPQMEIDAPQTRITAPEMDFDFIPSSKTALNEDGSKNFVLLVN
jgi:hypothetical protein